MNRVIITGNLSRDPELSTTNSGISVCRFTVAVQRGFKNSEGEREADFFNVVVWRAPGENCARFLKKGSKCGVIGRLQNSSYEGSDGTRRYTTEIIADEVEFLSSKPSDGDSSSPAPAPKQTQSKSSELQPIDDDTLPF